VLAIKQPTGISLASPKTAKEPQFTIPSPLAKTDSKGYYCTTTHGPDLYVNARNAVRYMSDWLEKIMVSLAVRLIVFVVFVVI